MTPRARRSAAGAQGTGGQASRRERAWSTGATAVRPRTRGSLFFVDDDFIGDKSAVRKLLPALRASQAERGKPFAFYPEASVNLAADEDLVREMVEAGFTSVFIGIETASVEALRETKKRQNVGVDLTAAIETLTRAGLEAEPAMGDRALLDTEEIVLPRLRAAMA